MHPALFVVPLAVIIAYWLVLREGVRAEAERRRLVALGERLQRVAARLGGQIPWIHGRGHPGALNGLFALRRVDRLLRSLESTCRLRVPSRLRRMAFASTGEILDRLEERLARIEGAVAGHGKPLD